MGHKTKNVLVLKSFNPLKPSDFVIAENVFQLTVPRMLTRSSSTHSLDLDFSDEGNHHD